MYSVSASQWRGSFSRWNRVSHSQPWWIRQVLADIHRGGTGQAEVRKERVFFVCLFFLTHLPFLFIMKCKFFSPKYSWIFWIKKTWSSWCSLCVFFSPTLCMCIFFTFRYSLVIQMSSWIAASRRTSRLLPSFLWQPQEAGPRVSIHLCTHRFQGKLWHSYIPRLLLFDFQLVYVLFLFSFVTSGPFYFALCRVPFWRFLITGADQNQELKVWCTVSWTCLQTIRLMVYSIVN